MKQVYFEPGQIYHIYNRANGSENLFRCHENYKYFLRKYQEKISGIADTIAYCLMPNHFHLLVKIKGEKELEDFICQISKQNRRPAIPPKIAPGDRHHFIIRRSFHNFFSGYAKAFNKYHDRRGSLLQQNTKRKIVINDTYLLNVIIYIHLNPVNHEFTVKPEEWPHSSFHAYIEKEVNTSFTKQILEWFGGRKAFLEAHCNHDDFKNHHDYR